MPFWNDTNPSSPHTLSASCPLNTCSLFWQVHSQVDCVASISISPYSRSSVSPRLRPRCFVFDPLAITTPRLLNPNAHLTLRLFTSSGLEKIPASVPVVQPNLDTPLSLPHYSCFHGLPAFICLQHPCPDFPIRLLSFFIAFIDHNRHIRDGLLRLIRREGAVLNVKASVMLCLSMVCGAIVES
jgi:hypothetical protein